MDKKGWQLIKIGFWTLGIILIIREFYLGSKANCDAFNELLNTQYRGIIIKKYIDSTEHSYHTLEIKDLYDSNVKKLILEFDKTGFYFHAKLRDTIIKDLGSDTIFVNNERGENSYIINFGCKDTL